MMKKISMTILLIFSAVTVLTAHPAPRPMHSHRPAPPPRHHSVSGPDLLLPGLLLGGLFLGGAIIAATAEASAKSEAEANRVAIAQAQARQAQVYTTTTTQSYTQPESSVVVVSSPIQTVDSSEGSTNRTFLTKISVLRADGKTMYYDSVFKRPVRYAGDVVYLSTISVDDVRLNYAAIQNVSYEPYR